MSAKIMKPGMGDMSKTPGIIRSSGAQIKKPMGTMYKTGTGSFNSGTARTSPGMMKKK